ncbi:unnamed protein product, partial [Effrenium voratum]
EGWGGPSCGVPTGTCEPKCQHGLCDAVTGSCVCEEGYTGGDCSLAIASCPQHCNFHGLCLNGVCACGAGWSGPDCGRRYFAPGLVTADGAPADAGGEDRFGFLGGVRADRALDAQLGPEPRIGLDFNPAPAPSASVGSSQMQPGAMPAGAMPPAAMPQLTRFSPSTHHAMVKVLCVLYEDPKEGYPTSYARDSIPEIKAYPGGQTTPSPSAVDFTPGHLLGSVTGALGLRKFLEAQGHNFVVTSSKDGPDSVFEQELPDADVVISQPFWPAYMSAERFEKAKNLKLCLTAGIGSDHVDLAAACRHNVTVAEVTFCNSISVAEHVVMSVLNLVRSFVPGHQIAESGGWHIADCVSRAYDVEGMQVGTVGAGRIGLAVLKRLKPFDMVLHYFDNHRLPDSVEKELNLTYHDSVQSLVKVCDVVTINCPLHPKTEHLFNEEMIHSMKRGSYLINTARGKICDASAVAKACEEGHLAGYAGDVWFPQPAPSDHVWRQMRNNAMTPHVSGTSLSAQARYAAGVREILECFFAAKPIRDEYLIVHEGRLAGAGAHSYTEGNTTGGSEEAARFKEERPCKAGLQRLAFSLAAKGRICGENGACSKRGTCDTGTGRCRCQAGFHGEVCEHQHCPGFQESGQECHGNGLCQEGRCSCSAGFGGEVPGSVGLMSCHLKICPLGCGAGTCVEGACVCPEGWQGETCEDPHCAGGCGHGSCGHASPAFPGSCVCDAGWTGASCDMEVAPGLPRHVEVSTLRLA